MKINKQKLALLTLTVIVLTLALTAVAYAYQIPESYRPANQPFALTGEPLETGQDAAGRTILILQIIAGGLLYFAAPIAVIMVAVGAITMIIGGDDPDKLGNAKKTLIYAVVGLILIMLSYSIIRIILTLILQAAEGTI